MKFFFTLLTLVILATPQASQNINKANDSLPKNEVTSEQKRENLRLKLEKKNLILVNKQIDAIRKRYRIRLARKSENQNVIIN